jgi:hypothetical protein
VLLPPQDLPPRHFLIIVRTEADMMPSQQTRLDRIHSCLSDLSDNGIELVRADERQLERLVYEHLEYFQLMLGYDSDIDEIIELIRHEP